MHRLWALLLAFILVSLFISAPVQAAEKQSRLLVKFQEGVDKQAAARRNNARIRSEIPRLGVVVLESSDGPEITKNRFRRERVEYVEEDAVAEALDSNDQLYISQWALPKISWNLLEASASAFNPAVLTKIAVVDTGVDYTHPDLSGKVDVVSGWDFVNNDSDAMDDNLHGTHVAGIASATTGNSIGIAGVSINSTQVIPVKELNSSGSGYYSWIASGIIWAADHGAKVINLSLGGMVSSNTLQNAINYAWNKGAVITAAAGNSNNTRRLYPAYYNRVIAVWASDQNDKKASFSSYGNWVDVGAPGVSILSTVPLSLDFDGTNDGYALLSGTSMATPEVTGLAGLLFSKNSWTNSQVRSRIEATTDPISERLFTRGLLGKGRINVSKALK